MTTVSTEIQFDADVEPVLSYALAHNRVPVVRRLRVENPGASELSVTVNLAIEDAQGALTQPWQSTFSLGAGVSASVDDLDLRLDPAQLLLVEEQRPGQLRVKVTTDDGDVTQRVFPTQVLAAHQWLAAPQPLAFEMLAAFVTPNDPAIAGLVAEASALLMSSTGSSSVQGYQAGPERVDEIVQALYEAMAARDIRYQEPPASWADDGQKIRTPSEVLEGRVGTCLDTVVVLAAALEQAGIRPLLWVVEGHAFLGYWRHEMALDAVAQTDIGAIVNQVELGNIVLVETTMVTGGSEAAPFADTHRPPAAAFLSDDLHRVYAVTDVWAARRTDILPLPSRVRDLGGTVQVVEYRPAEHSRPQQVFGSVRPVGVGAVAATPVRVQQWKNALLDLSLRNKLINFSEKSGIALAVPQGGLAALEDLVNDRRVIGLLPGDQIDEIQLARGARNASDLEASQLLELLDTRHAVFSSVPGSSYVSRFRSLAYKARTIVEETGANNLYLALGTLIWSLDGKPLRSPLVLIPVTLVGKGRSGGYSLELDESGSSTPNYCLLEKLKQIHTLEIPGLANPVEDASGIDLGAALRNVREAVAEAGLPYRVEESADLAILQFAKFRLWKDLDEHWADLMQNPLVRHLVESPTQPFTDPAGAADTVDLDDLDAHCPIPADSSQLQAISWATAGHTFVLEGPPGTGKSQTITNLLTRAIAEGKKVLFVAEKRAALDVVHKRLQAVGMSAFCLDLHDKGSKPAGVREQIRIALDHAVAVDSQGYRAAADDLRSSRNALARYAERLHEPNGVGLSYYSAHTQQLTVADVRTSLPVPLHVVTSAAAEDVERLRHLLDRLPDTAELARPRAGHPWGFVQPGAPGAVDVVTAMRATRAVSVALAAVPRGGTLGAAVAAVQSPAELSALAVLTEKHLPLEVLDQTVSAEWAARTDSLSREIAAFLAAAHPGLDVATPAALELPLADLHARATAALQGSFLGRKKKLKALLTEMSSALRSGSNVSPKRVPELTAALLQVQGAVHGIASRATGVPGLSVPSAWNPLTDEGRDLVERQVEWLRWAGRAVRQANTADTAGRSFTAAVRSYVDSPTGEVPDTTTVLRTAASALRDLAALFEVDDQHWVTWCQDRGLVELWELTSGARGEQDAQALPLRRWLAFLEALQPLTTLGLHEAHRLLREGTCPSDEARRAFESGLANTALAERAAATGLDAFDAERHMRTLARFESTTGIVRTALVEVIPSEVLGARPFHAGAERGQVGALSRELTKQRRGLGVRKLLQTYGPLITDVMPCVLVSPDSVSRFFPVGSELFDLVVFDEASQIRVADAVGAMGRARSVVVVGDSKQMPPTSFAEPASEREDGTDDSDNLVVEDEESILSECVLASIDRLWLSWHYRSVDESLIAFSNQRYYDGKLSSFPGPAVPGRARPDAGISLVRVQGVFLRSGKGKLLRTNDAEARAVLAEIQRRFAADADGSPSIGVVTFNQQQRAHIEALIRDEGGERLVDSLDGRDGEGLFIKNLENVQGDERDVILFSTGFSANDKGVVPLNFGPLNRGGGERRLNVAITRARRQVIVFSSFDPAMLRAEETTSVGIKHLRAYLDLAAHGTSALAAGKTVLTAVDRHRDEVARALRETGLRVHTDVGLSDFKIDLVVARAEAPDQPVLAVLLDGPGWFKRRTVNDRDGLPSAVLAGLMGWPAVERVWAPAWVADPAPILKRLSAVATAGRTAESPLAARRAQPVAQGEAAIPPPSPIAAPLSSRRHGMLGQEPYVPWGSPTLGSTDVLDALPEVWAARQVREALEQAVAAEGPIHLDVLARLVAGSFQLTRVNANRAAAILSGLPSDLVPMSGDRFAWPREKSPSMWTGFRERRNGEARPLENVALREISNAMVALCADCGGMSAEELHRETVAVFGGRRLTNGMTDRIAQALVLSERDGRLAARGEIYVAI
ncbi:MAG: hypothetical protein QOE71_3223 [Pseudonocardiales bacterium]|nr:hypothetical protein [Pseudonocardiales bacterium]